MNFSHLLSRFTSSRPGRRAAVGVMVLGMLFMAACAATGVMDTQPRYNPLSASNSSPGGSSARLPVAGSVPYYGDLPANSPIITGLDANGESYKGFPLAVTKDLLALGQERYIIYCKPCHGATAEGDGLVIPFGFTKPPDLLGEDISTSPNGDLFAAITNGFGKMYPYGYKVNYTERWAIIAYIRAMEMVEGPVTVQNLTADQIDKIGKLP